MLTFCRGLQLELCLRGISRRCCYPHKRTLRGCGTAAVAGVHAKLKGITKLRFVGLCNISDDDKIIA